MLFPRTGYVCVCVCVCVHMCVCISTHTHEVCPEKVQPLLNNKNINVTLFTINKKDL